MTVTVRDIITRAGRWLLDLGAGDQPHAAELSDGLQVLQDLIEELPGLGVGGPWVNVDITAAYEAREDERIRVQDGYTVAVTLPNTVEDYTGAPEYFDRDSWTGATRAPRDGARVLIIGDGAQQLYVYNADVNSWLTALGLTISSTVPFSRTYHAGLAAMLAERLALGKIDRNGNPVAPAPAVIAMARNGETKLKALLTRRPRVTSADGPVLSRSRQAYASGFH